MAGRKRGLTFYRKKKVISKELINTVLLYLFWGFAMTFIAFVFVYCFGIRTSVIGVSMEPELYNGQEVFINRFTYFFTKPKSSDVVVFRPNGNKNAHYYVKRVVAVPGDSVIISDGILYVNDTLYSDSVIADKIENPGIAENIIILGDDEYFVIGDNINNSEDSRSSNVGVVKKEYIIGKAWLKLSNDQSGMGLIE